MRLVLAITGASGAVYGITLLRELSARGVEVHLILTEAARYIIKRESPFTAADVRRFAAHAYEENDFAAPIASGSFKHDGMAVVPCSMKTLAGIASGYAANLVQRAADVTIKERRRLILAPRETPLSPIHLENMLKLARLGVVIMPPVPAYYHRPQTLNDIIDFTVGRMMDQLQIENDLVTPWGDRNCQTMV